MKTKKLLMAILFCSLCLPLTVFATQHPLKLSSDGRIEVVAYSPYNVVPIAGTTFTTTQLVFGKDEYIENVQNGDLGAWTVSISESLPNMMFVKPTTYDSNTNMTVVTNEHTYYFHLSSNAKEQKKEDATTYAIHFIYPEEQRALIAKQVMDRHRQQQAEISAFQNPSDYHWNYSFHGDRSIMPLHVFDDGKFTYMQFREHQVIPAIFVVTSPTGAESVVNYRQDGRYIIIQRIAPQFTLRLGREHVTSIFNNTVIKKLRAHGYSR